MQFEWLDWVLLIAFFLLSLGIGLYYSRDAGKGLAEFFLGGRNLTWWMAGTSMVATTFAADTPLLVAGLVAQNGVSGNWIWWNMLLGGMLTTFFFARYWRKSGVVTEVELIELRYGGKPAAFLRGFKAVYLGLILNAVIIGWVNKAMTTILIAFFGLDASTALLYVSAAMLFVAVYTAASGLMGVAVTDAIQFVVAMVGCIVLAILVVYSPEIGGISGLTAKLPSWSLDFFPTMGSDTSSAGQALSIGVAAFFARIGVQWWASWYPGGEPGGGGYVAQRMMSCRDEKSSVYATLFFQIAHYALRPWPWILVGLCAIVLYPQLGPGEKEQGFVLAMRDYLPVGMRGLLLAAFFAAYMSTIATQLNWGASYLMNDLYRRFVRPESTEQHLVFVSRVITLLLMGVSLWVTTQLSTIESAWGFIIECGAGLGMVLILRWYWWRLNAWSEIAATLIPFVAYAYAHFYRHEVFPNSFLFTVAVTTIGWLLVTLLTKPESAETLQHFYRRVEPAGWWNPVAQSLGRKTDNRQIPALFICWICGILLGYSVLFFLGELIFQHFTQAAGYAAVSLVALLGLRYWLPRTFSQ